MTNSASVAAMQSTAVGGSGGNVPFPNYEPEGGDGGSGIEAIDSGVSLCEMVSKGGIGGDAGAEPGTGGDALRASGSVCAVQSVNSAYTGGPGGTAWDFLASIGGVGGDAVHADAQAGVQSFEDTLLRGPGGACLVNCPNGKPGKKVNQTAGGQVTFLGNYCVAGVSANGCTAAMDTIGTPSASNSSPFSLVATGAEGMKLGQFVFSSNGHALNAWGNSGSFLCVASPLWRSAPLAGSGTSGACDGAFSYALNAHWAQKPAQNPGAGSLVQAQLWYRDPQSTSNQDSALSDAIEFPVCP